MSWQLFIKTKLSKRKLTPPAPAQKKKNYILQLSTLFTSLHGNRSTSSFTIFKMNV